MEQKRELSIDELYAMLPDWDQIPRIWRMQVHGKRIIVKSYGLCHYWRVIFLWRNGREFYRLERDMKIWRKKTDNETPRREYFKGNLVRKYIGWQNCFVEFCEFLWKCRNYPTKKRFSQAAQALGLDEKTTSKYMIFFQECFYSKRR